MRISDAQNKNKSIAIDTHIETLFNTFLWRIFSQCDNFFCFNLTCIWFKTKINHVNRNHENESNMFSLRKRSRFGLGFATEISSNVGKKTCFIIHWSFDYSPTISTCCRFCWNIEDELVLKYSWSLEIWVNETCFVSVILFCKSQILCGICSKSYKRSALTNIIKRQTFVIQ